MVKQKSSLTDLSLRSVRLLRGTSRIFIYNSDQCSCLKG